MIKKDLGVCFVGTMLLCEWSGNGIFVMDKNVSTIAHGDWRLMSRNEKGHMRIPYHVIACQMRQWLLLVVNKNRCNLYVWK